MTLVNAERAPTSTQSRGASASVILVHTLYI